MAILPSLPGLEVRIFVGKRYLEEFPDYDVQAEPGALGAELARKTVAKYVQSTTSEFLINFKVAFDFHFNFPTLGFEVYLDGSLVREPIIRREGFMEEKEFPLGYFLNITGVRCAVTEDGKQKCVLHKLSFSKIETSEFQQAVRGQTS